MSGIFLWGTGFTGLAEETSPDVLQDATSSIPDGAFDISELAPWFEVSLVCEGPQSRCWISAKHGEFPPLIMTGSCSSSLDVAWHFHRLGLFPVWSSILALRQWAGRGQFGRTWQSAPGNIYASWHLPNPPKLWAGMLSLVVGYMIIRGLMSYGIEVQLKWPNDLLIKGKTGAPLAKVGGILIEARGDVFIAGVGINLVSAPENLQIDDPRPGAGPSPVAFPPTSLKAAVGVSASPLNLWARLVQIGQSCYQETISCGRTTERFISDLQPHMAFMGEEVIIDDYQGGKSGAGLYQARMVGLDQSGALLIRASGRKRLIRSGRIYPLNSERKELEARSQKSEF